ncbi:MAG: amidohydrolase [Myxococcota bacterium]|nr:amidohydrolase [Myxococcota bacterium]
MYSLLSGAKMPVIIDNRSEVSSMFERCHYRTMPVMLGLLLGGLGCASAPAKSPVLTKVDVPLEPPVAKEPTTLLPQAPMGAPVVIENVTLLTARTERARIENGWIRLANGRIVALGAGTPPAGPSDEQRIDGQGGYVTPGLIDTHSHMGVYSKPGVWAHADGNEMTNPIRAGVRAEEAFWPQDPSIERAVGGGVTTIQVLPGSGNLMGGRAVVLKLRPRRDSRSMRFPGARDGLKMACGENPKRVYGKYRKALPMSRMGSLYLMRETWVKARRYQNEWATWRKNPQKKEGDQIISAKPPTRDLMLETLAQVLEGNILVHIHCYRADEMLLQIKLAKEFGYSIRSFHHAVEAYKIRDVLAVNDISVSTWADWWGFKIEAYDAVEQNLALLAEAGALGILHPDSPEGIQRMNQEASKAYYAGLNSGVKISENDALRWITANAAWALGIEEEVGTLKVGKMADVVLWDRHPFSVYARAQKVFIDGYLVHEDGRTATRWSDFEVGQ